MIERMIERKKKRKRDTGKLVPGNEITYAIDERPGAI